MPATGVAVPVPALVEQGPHRRSMVSGRQRRRRQQSLRGRRLHPQRRTLRLSQSAIPLPAAGGELRRRPRRQDARFPVPRRLDALAQHWPRQAGQPRSARQTLAAIQLYGARHRLARIPRRGATDAGHHRPGRARILPRPGNPAGRRGAQRSGDRPLRPNPRRNRAASVRQLQDGRRRRPDGGGGSSRPGTRRVRPARGGRVHHAAHRHRQSERAHHHDRRENRGSHSPAAAIATLQRALPPGAAASPALSL